MCREMRGEVKGGGELVGHWRWVPKGGEMVVLVKYIQQ
jgi:hypothetical protein